MLDYQRIIDDVRSSLYAAGPKAAETVRAAASAYAFACQEVHERLRKCGELLKAGLRSEALQQAEMEPNLLDVVATLDFPEREVWAQHAAQFGIVVPAPLPLDVAAELNEAYAIEQPLGVLLARHRLLALARSPLRLRIATLREIAEMDSNNALWLEDLQLYEKERLKQIQREAGDALTASDTATAIALADELENTPWLELPPKGLLNHVDSIRQKLITRQARRELERIDAEMNAAFSAFEIEQMRRLREQWLANLPESGFDEQAPICQRMAPALEWLEEYEVKERQKQEHAAALAALEEAVDDDQITETRLERRYRAATQHGHEVPPALDRRVKVRIESLRLSARRRFRLRLTLASLAGITLAAVIAVIIFRQIHAADVASHAAVLAKLINDSKLAEARKYTERLNKESPRVAKAAEIHSLVVQLHGLIQQDEDRRQRLDGILEESRKAAGTIADWTSQNHVTKLLHQAEKLAKTDSEKADVKRLQLELGEATHKLQRREDEEFTRSLTILNDRVRRLEDQRLDASVRQAEINHLRVEGKALHSRSTNVTATLREQVKPLLARLDALEARLRSEQKQQAALAKITRGVGNDASFTKVLEEYNEEFPDSARAADFRRACEEAPLWQGLARYTKLAEKWSEHDHTTLNAHRAKELIDAANVVLKEYTDYPDADTFRMRLPYLEAIARRGSTEEKSLVAKLRANYGKPWIADLSMVKMKNGDCYYMKVKPDLSDEQWANKARYVVDFDLTEKRFPLNKRREVVSAEISPQAVWATRARKILSGLTDEKWEATMYDLLQSIYANREVDALPRLTLTRQTLEAACQGSVPFERAFKTHLSAINDPSLDPFANWLDPDDEQAKIARAKAEMILKELPDFMSAARQAAQERQSLRSPVGTRYVWVGWLCRDEVGKWECRHSQGDIGNGELVVVRKPAADGRTRIDPVGRVQNGVFSLTTLSSDVLLEGRPVFLTVPLAAADISNVK